MVERTVGSATRRVGPLGLVRAAVGVLTRLPIGTVVDDPGAAAFPLVGAALGLVAALPLLLFGAAGEPVLGAIAGVATLAAISGGLHLDGLADTADALLAPDAAAAERARKDPAVGPGGTAAILIVLGSQVAALASVMATSDPPLAAAILAVGGATSRWLPVVTVTSLRRWVGAGGLGAWFGARVSGMDAVIGGIVVAVVVGVATAVVGVAAVVVPAALIGIGVGIGGTALVARARGGLDGDGLGAAVEMTLTATLVVAAVVAR